MDEGCIAVIFRSRRNDADAAGYEAMAERMVALAEQQPGYLGIDSVSDEDGESITVSYWADEDAARAWKRVAEHAEAQRLGRERWYSEYSVYVTRILRSYRGP